MKTSEIESQLKALEEESASKEEVERVEQMALEYAGEDRVIDTETYLEAMEKLRGGESFKIFSGLPQLDYIIEGFWEGNVCIISGPTKEGKTTFCQTLTMKFAAEGKGVLWLPFDTPGEELIQRFSEPVKFYLPKKNAAVKDLNWVEQKIIEGIAKYDTRVVFIDHLGSLVHTGMTNANYATYLQHIMVKLKEIAIKWRVVIFLNHHINKIPTDQPPMLSNLKDSSGVAQEADQVLMIWRRKKRTDQGVEYGNTALLQVQANRRNGRSGIVKLDHKGDHFEESEDE